MGQSCVFKPTVKNNKGEEVNSKLFDDLLHFSSNDREFAKKYYFIGTNEQFLKTNASQVVYDENGEITFKSLKNIISLDLKEEKILEQLNKDLKFGEQSYEEAISLMTSFNNTSEYNDKYMATISNVENGKVLLQVVKKNKENQLNLETNIANKNLFDRIKAAIQRLGGDITFIDERYSKYDTINAQKAESGFYNIIFLSKKGNIDADMAEEAGHFAVGALGNSPLVRRLESLCTPEVQQKIFKDHYSDIEGRKNPRREAAGFLVGQYIKNEIDRETSFDRLIGRIVNAAKKMFYKLTLDDVNSMRLEAQMLAKNIARGFMSGENAGSIEQALSNKEILYSAQDSVQVSSFKNVLKQLNLLTTEMTAIDRTLYKKWKAIEADTAIGRLFQNPSMFADMAAINGIQTALEQLADATPEIIQMLDSVEYDASALPKNAKKLRQVRTFVQSSVAIMGIIDNMVISPNLPINENVKQALINSYNTLSSLIRGADKLEVNLLKKERQLYLSFLKDIYGKEYIDRASRVLFNFKNFKLEKVSGGQESLYKMMESLDRDDNFMNRWLASMADSSDIINQLVYKTKMSANAYADEAVLRTWDTLRELQNKFKQKKINTNKFIEVSNRTGQITGNYISPLNWGDWENDWQEFKQTQKEIFLSDPTIESKTKIEKEFLWDTYFRPLSKDWHKAHSKYDQQSGRYKPNDNYKNNDYDNLSLEEKSALNELLEVKKDLDDLITYQSYNGEIVYAAHTNLYRMPQFVGSTQNRVENLTRQMSLGKAISGAFRQNIVNIFTVTSEDRDYGSAATHNVIDDDIFSDALDFEKEKIKRVPLYGINKLKDMSQLSTDLFSSLLQYSAMANTYSATSTIVDIIETGKDVLANRRVKGLQTEIERTKKSNVYSRYCDFLDAQVYNLYAKQDYKFKEFAISKLAGFLTGLASKVFLGGNIAGGAVNVMTGFNELTKEAIAGELYTLADFKKANSIYFQNLPANWLEAGQAYKNNKVSLFMKYFNVQNNLEAEVRGFSSRKSRLTRLNPFGDNLMLPYKSGDHYMQTMSYLATANRYKFRDTDGKKIISLYEALIPVPIDPNNPKAGKTLQLKDGIKYIDKENNVEREWTMEDKVKFQSACKETNNRMHGIYNKMDKTAFHNTLFGQCVLSMRGYALGLLYRRFSTNHYNVALGRESEGSLVTMGKVVLNMFGGTGNIIPSSRAILCPFGDSVKNSMQQMGFSVEQYRNMRRNWADFALIGVLALLKCLTAKSDDDDDEDDDVTKGLIYYFASRLYMEQNAYNTPWGIWQEQKSVLDWMPSGLSVIGQMSELGKYIITQEEYARDSKTHKEGDKKWAYKFGSYFPYYRNYKILEHPYESAKSYEYGRATYK